MNSWADRLLPFDFKVTHIAGTKLGIVDYLSRHPTFEAPQPSSYDEQYVVKSIQHFFSACSTVEKLYNKECNHVPSHNFKQDVSKSIPCINNILYIDRSFQTKISSTCINQQESDDISATSLNYSGNTAIYKLTPREDAVNLFTNFNQSESRKFNYGCKPREGATNLCTETGQSQSGKRY